MKLEPLNKQVIGRVVITKPEGAIIRPDQTKGVSKFILVEEVSPEAKLAGFAPGDLVLPETISNIFLKGGDFYRATVLIDKIMCRVRDVPLSAFLNYDGRPLVDVLREEEEAAAREAAESAGAAA